MNLRLIAARVIDHVASGQSLPDCLEPTLVPIQSDRDRAFVQAICYGVCRFYTRLDYVLSLLLKKPMEAKDSDVHALLLVGLYQLMAMRVPPHAAVSETVNATDKFKKSWARGFVNAILREYLRREVNIKSQIEKDDEARYAHPMWWIDKIKKAWPTQWEAILAANNEHPPFALRVNQAHLSRDDYVTQLAANNRMASIISETKNGILLNEPVPVEELSGFANGDVTVQDGAAQLAAELLDLAPGQHVIDACAAPGGKLTHLLEIQPNLSVVAVENNSKRLQTIKENLQRLKLNATCVCADVCDVSAWWNGEYVDRILLDAPCSASGVIRRHPDIKLLREPSDVASLANEQSRMLEALWPLLKPGGVLLYATCSIFSEENTQVMERFLAAHQDAVEDKLSVEWGITCQVGRQILPGMHQMDGFYYARLSKML